MVASGHQGDTSSKLPAMWLIRAYRSLTRPYKKNVKYIVLVRPSAMLSAMMVVLRPFLSLKAARKLHKVGALICVAKPEVWPAMLWNKGFVKSTGRSRCCLP